jgi:hypothetical protein
MNKFARTKGEGRQKTRRAEGLRGRSIKAILRTAYLAQSLDTAGRLAVKRHLS